MPSEQALSTSPDRSNLAGLGELQGRAVYEAESYMDL